MKNLKPHSTIAAFVLLIQFSGIFSLTCLHCKGVTKPRYCSRAAECDPGEVCSMESDTNEFGEIVYNLECRPSTLCQNVTSPSSCTSCCYTDLCNSKGCGQLGYPTPRGPVCYHCKTPTAAGRCHDIDFCQVDEVCMMQGRVVFGETLYSTMCVSHHECEDIPTSVGGVGRRGISERSHELHSCDYCCTSDLCNSNCAGNASMTPVDGHWGTWSAWTPCSSSCGTGTKTRQRACDNPAPMDGGRDCIGSYLNTTTCNGYACRGTNATDCLDIQTTIYNASSGVYFIETPITHTQIEVYCDMDTEGGGWTVFQKRYDGSVNFTRNYSEYENGFGDVTGEFWLGLKYIYELTNNRNSILRMDFVTFDDESKLGEYDNFYIEDELQGYRLNVGAPLNTSGILEYGAMAYHDGNRFSTYDKDQDQYSGSNCAVEYGGAFWHNDCFKFNPNAKYGYAGSTDGDVMSQTDWTIYQPARAWKMMFKRH